MCGRYAASADPGTLTEIFEIDEVAGNLPPASFNVAPTDEVPAVLERVRKEDGAVTRKLVPLRWGLIPSWSKDATNGARMINARSETVASKPAFKTPCARRRCLLPADGYYEWYTTGATQKGKPVKQPFFIRPKDGGLLIMAGLYEFWRRPDAAPGQEDSWVSSCTIITRTATDELGRIHDRMPLVVDRDRWDAWLDPSFTDAQQALDLLHEPTSGLTAYAVTTRVNTVANNGPDLIAPLPEER